MSERESNLPKSNLVSSTELVASTLANWCEELPHWKDPDAEKDWRWEKKEMTEDEMVGWHHRLNGHECEQAPGDGEGRGGLACCRPWGRKESDTTERLNWTELNWTLYRELTVEPWGCRPVIAQGWSTEQPLTSDLLAIENIIFTKYFTKLLLNSRFKCLVMTSFQSQRKAMPMNAQTTAQLHSSHTLVN